MWACVAVFISVCACVGMDYGTYPNPVIRLHLIDHYKCSLIPNGHPLSLSLRVAVAKDLY